MPVASFLSIPPPHEENKQDRHLRDKQISCGMESWKAPHRQTHSLIAEKCYFWAYLNREPARGPQGTDTSQESFESSNTVKRRLSTHRGHFLFCLSSSWLHFEANSSGRTPPHSTRTGAVSTDRRHAAGVRRASAGRQLKTARAHAPRPRPPLQLRARSTNARARQRRRHQHDGRRAILSVAKNEQVGGTACLTFIQDGEQYFLEVLSWSGRS